MSSVCCSSFRILLVALAAGQCLPAIENCGNQDFQGAYGVLSSGAATAFPPPLAAFIGPFGRAGRALADGNGNVSFETTASYNGFVFSEPFSGTYAVGSDCSVVINLLVGAPGFPQFKINVTFAGVISDDLREVSNVFVSPPGGAVRLTLRKQDKTNCSNLDLFGGYRLDLSGTIVSQSPNPPGIFARVGRLDFDGSGGFTAKTWANYKGSAAQENFSGTYTVNPWCKVTMQYALGDQNFTWIGDLTDAGSGADLIVSSPPGAAVVGTLKHQ